MQVSNEDFRDLANWVLNNVDFKVETNIFKNAGECEIILPDIPLFFSDGALQFNLEREIVEILKNWGEFKELEKEYKIIY